MLALVTVIDDIMNLVNC